MANHRPTRYGGISQSFHWLLALLVIAAVVIVLYGSELPKGPERGAMYGLHKSFGVLILGLAVLRLLWRFGRPPPALPDGMASWERRAAQISHFLLYLLLFAQPVLGILGSWAGDRAVDVFGLFTLPVMITPSKAMNEFWYDLHVFCGYTFLVLIGIHTAAALKHHFIDKDDVLTRMLPGKGG